jgi:hypothetical protein
MIMDIRCEHQVEIEVWPSRAEVYFADERNADPATSQVRFDAMVYNAPTSRVIWEVRDMSGNPGRGTVDNTGLYRAPSKGVLESGTTEVLCATAADDPLRKAFAYVTLVGKGPAVPPPPTILVVPRTAEIYFQGNINAQVHNQYMDPSKTVQRFEAIITNTQDQRVEWKFDGVVQSGHELPWIEYKAPATGNKSIVQILATLKSNPSISGKSQVTVVNYIWPGIV